MKVQKKLKLRKTLSLKRWFSATVLSAATCFGLGCAQFSMTSDCDTGCTSKLSLFGHNQCENAHVCNRPTMANLAKDLDYLEHEIDEYGSIVAKGPDVWGEDRLIKYRQKFNELMQEESKFDVVLSAFISRTDQAFLANATALGMAVSGRPATLGDTDIIGNTTTVTQVKRIPSKDKPDDLSQDTRGTPTTFPADTSKIVQELIPDKLAQSPAEEKRKVEQTTSTAPKRGERIEQEAASLEEVSGLIVTENTIARNAPLRPSTLPTVKGGTEVGLEPTERLEQKKRYLRHWEQILRANEGDDTADSAGYALHLMRIPVSILPGSKTRTGYGAEINVSLQMQLGNEFLPSTFRTLMRNDIVDQLAGFYATLLNDNEVQGAFKDALKNPEIQKILASLSGSITTDDRTKTKTTLTDADKGASGQYDAVSLLAEMNKTSYVSKNNAKWNNKADGSPRIVNPSEKVGQMLLSRIRAQISRASSTKIRRTQNPFPTSQILEIYGEDRMVLSLLMIYLTFINDINEDRFVQYQKLQSLLQEEVGAAFQMLALKGNEGYWDQCNEDLYKLVRTRDAVHLEVIRDGVIKGLSRDGQSNRNKLGCTYDIAWAILVEATLLNHRLTQDMKETFAAKGGAVMHDGWHYFHLPNPPQCDRDLFNTYVQTRFPIHVFSVDPEVQEQNVGDTFSRRREMQLALSLAFVSGKISGRNLTKFTRRLEADFTTIDLNRTVVGFTHGNDNFGWRFYPRFQTPETDTNLTVIGRDMLIGGPSKDAEIRKRKLEAGPRECVAMVIMPSFVPYVSMEVGCSWFKLTNPKHKEFTNQDTMKLSKVIKSIQNCSGQIQDAHCYRDGDMQRMMARCKQLEARLPLQTLNFQVPYSNTLGGFALINNGSSDLVPELRGWYGAPGLSTKADTSLFLIGDHFSVNDTKVIVGGQEIVGDRLKLLSRQIMRITVTKDFNILPNGSSVDVYLATAYGATTHLEIPVIPVEAKKEEKAEAAEGFAFAPTDITVKYVLAQCQDCADKYKLGVVRSGADLKIVKEREMELKWKDATGTAPKQVMLNFAFKVNGANFVLPSARSGLITLSPGENGKYTLNQELLNRLAFDLLATLNHSNTYTQANHPAVAANPTTTVQVVITPVEPDRSVQKIPASNQINFKFEASQRTPGQEIEIPGI